MKVKNNHIAGYLILLGWQYKGTCQSEVQDKVIQENDPGAYKHIHDFYYGPLVTWKSQTYHVVKRPAGLTRRQEKEVMREMIMVASLYKLGQHPDLASTLLVRSTKKVHEWLKK